MSVTAVFLILLLSGCGLFAAVGVLSIATKAASAFEEGVASGEIVLDSNGTSYTIMDGPYLASNGVSIYAAARNSIATVVRIAFIYRDHRYILDSRPRRQYRS